MSVFEGTFQYRVTDCLVWLQCDPVPWTTFMAHPTRQNCAHAYGACAAASTVATHRGDLVANFEEGPAYIERKASPFARVEDETSAADKSNHATSEGVTAEVASPVPEALPRPTVGDLAAVAGISLDTFARVRTAAKIKVNAKGAKARNRRYTVKEVDRLIATALAGNYMERTAMAEKWAKWSGKKAADKPQPSR